MTIPLWIRQAPNLLQTDLAALNAGQPYTFAGVDLTPLTNLTLFVAAVRGATFTGALINGISQTIEPELHLNDPLNNVMIFQGATLIGCLRYKTGDIAQQTDTQVAAINDEAFTWWTANRDWVIAAEQAHQ